MLRSTTPLGGASFSRSMVSRPTSTRSVLALVKACASAGRDRGKSAPIHPPERVGRTTLPHAHDGGGDPHRRPATPCGSNNSQPRHGEVLAAHHAGREFSHLGNGEPRTTRRYSQIKGWSRANLKRQAL